MKSCLNHKNFFVVLLCAAVLCLAAAAANGRTINLRADGTGDYFTIQDAINASINDDIIQLQPGTYTGTGNRDIDFLGKAITVRSTDPDNNDIVAATIIDCNGTQKDPHRGFVFQNGEGPDSIIDGITVTGGYLTGSYYPSWAGSAILCDRSSPTISRCIVKENECAGGVIYCYRGNLILSGCTIRNNRSHAAVCLVKYGYLDVLNCMIIENNGRGISAQGDLTVTNSLIALNNGQGVYCSSGRLTITNSMIRDNSGTGIALTNNDSIIDNCVIERNIASSSGGAIFVSCDSINIKNSLIVNNVADKAGGLFLGDGNCRIDNCVIAENKAERWGGGIYSSKCTATMTNCTVYGNSGGEKGGGIGCQYNCDFTVNNCILWNNSAILGKEINLHVYSSPSRMTIGYSNVQGGMTDVFVGDSTLEWGAGNIDTSPQFVDPLSGDYHLRSSSPCIDAGADAGVYDDIEGNIRPFDYPGVDNNGELPEFDMGAYEVVPPPLEVPMHFTPQALNPGSRGKWLKAHFVLPEGFVVEDVDANTPATLEPVGIESDYINVFINEEGLVEIEIAFDRADFCGAGINYGPAEIMVVGLLTSGRYFYGSDTIRIITSNLKYLAVLASHWLEGGCGVPDWCGGVDLDRNTVVDFVDFVLLDGCCIEVIKK